MKSQTQILELILPDESREILTLKFGAIGADFQSTEGFQQFSVEAFKILVQHLPTDWLMVFEAIRSNRVCLTGISIKNLPCDDITNIPTPTDGFLSKQKPTNIAEAVQLAFCQLIGVIYCFKRERREAGVIHIIAARPGQEKALTSESSAIVLDWHVENAYSKWLRPRWVSLFCLRPDQERAAITKLADVRDAIPFLSTSALEVLQESKYSFLFPDSMGVKGMSEPMPILSGPLAEPEFRFSLEGKMLVADADPAKVAAAYSAIQELGQCMDVPESQHQIRLESGQLLFINNLVAAHCRSEFKFNEDLTKNRWLHRVLVHSSLFEARAARAEGINHFL